MREAASFIASRSNATAESALVQLFSSLERLLKRWTSRRRIVEHAELDHHIRGDIGLARDDVRWALDLPFSCDATAELQRRALRRRGAGWRDAR